jgi:two-component system sensor histidine kinase KdpD
MLNAIIARVVRLFDLSACTIIMPADDGEVVVRASYGPTPDLRDRDEIALMRWVFEQGEPAGVGTGPGRIVLPHRRLPNEARPRQQPPRRSSAMLYIPITSIDHTVGVLRVVRSLDKPRFTASEQQLLATLSNHVALAMERVRLTEEATRAAVLARSDELKSALLSAVSHELRTPLASIKASATSLLQEDVAWSPEDSRDLLQAIDEETDRLTRIVSNLLDLSRIEAGVLQPEREWNDVDELIRETVNRVRPLYLTHEMWIEVPADLPVVLFDYVQIAQVLMNLIENAAKYSPTGAPVTVSARETDGAVTICVADRGPGIPAGEETRVFDKFYRLESRNGAEGTGMGLSISRGIVFAHGGTIWVERRDGGGSCFCFTLPIDVPAQAEQAIDGEVLTRS